MLEETGSGSFVEAEGGEKRDEAKVGEFSRLLEAVHRLVYTKDDVGLAGGVSFKEGKEIEAGENGGGELMGEDFYVLGRVEVGSKVEVREIDEAKETLSETTELKRMLTVGREATWVEGSGRGKTVTTRSAANTTVYTRRVAALGAGEEERSGGPLLLCHGVVIRGGGESVVDGIEGPGSFDKLDELVVASPQPLQTVGAGKCGAEGEGRARGVKVEDRGRRRRDGRRWWGRRGESMWGW
jgi:hypothetical protein